MITNDKQYRSTRVQIEKIRHAIESSQDGRDEEIHPVFLAAHQVALKDQLEELEADVAKYDQLRSGAIYVFEAKSLRDLPKVLISARIARGMSQKDLGAFLGIHEQQIQRYESEQYRSASLGRLADIAEALNVQISERGELTGDARMHGVSRAGVSSFPVAEMYKRGYFEDFEGTLSQAKKNAEALVEALFRGAYGHPVASLATLHRRSVRSKGKVHEQALAAWEARVMTLADRNPPSATFDPETVKQEWIQGLMSLSARVDGVRHVAEYLRSAGVAFVVEPHLPGTLLDGAAFQTPNGTCAIAMTIRHDRLDNFWFTLLHELAHLCLHIGKGEVFAIFDDNDASATSELELEADAFAKEMSIPTPAWEACVSRFTQTEKAVLRDADRLGIAPAIIAGRIRRDANNYTILSSLVGSGEVRKFLN